MKRSTPTTSLNINRLYCNFKLRRCIHSSGYKFNNAQPIATDVASKYVEVNSASNYSTTIMRLMVRKLKVVFKGGELLFGCVHVLHGTFVQDLSHLDWNHILFQFIELCSNVGCSWFLLPSVLFWWFCMWFVVYSQYWTFARNQFNNCYISVS